jgi:hypothetical protein
VPSVQDPDHGDLRGAKGSLPDPCTQVETADAAAKSSSSAPSSQQNPGVGEPSKQAKAVERVGDLELLAPRIDKPMTVRPALSLVFLSIYCLAMEPSSGGEGWGGMLVFQLDHWKPLPLINIANYQVNELEAQGVYRGARG